MVKRGWSEPSIKWTRKSHWAHGSWGLRGPGRWWSEMSNISKVVDNAWLIHLHYVLNVLFRGIYFFVLGWCRDLTLFSSRRRANLLKAIDDRLSLSPTNGKATLSCNKVYFNYLLTLFPLIDLPACSWARISFSDHIILLYLYIQLIIIECTQCSWHYVGLAGRNTDRKSSLWNLTF